MTDEEHEIEPRDVDGRIGWCGVCGRGIYRPRRARRWRHDPTEGDE